MEKGYFKILSKMIEIIENWICVRKHGATNFYQVLFDLLRNAQEVNTALHYQEAVGIQCLEEDGCGTHKKSQTPWSTRACAHEKEMERRKNKVHTEN